MTRYEEVMSLSLRRGFLWPSVDIYGGFAGFYDYGHNGARLKKKWEDLWLNYFLSLNENYHLIDTTNILPLQSLKASGHVDYFTDVLVPCNNCKESFRGDHLIEDATGYSFEGLPPKEVEEKIKALGIKCPNCKGDLGESKAFNMMFPIAVGPTGKDEAFLRPETAQGVYLNFKREFESLRRKLPMGLAIIGRAFRNEISPRQGAYRMREFLQAELQIFFNPKTFEEELNFSEVEDYKIKVSFSEEKREGKVREISCKELANQVPKFFVYHMAKVQQFYLDCLTFPSERFRFAELSGWERAFYNKIHFDVEIDLPSLGGFKEVSGVHYRTDYDLKGHEKYSNQKMSIYFGGERFIPHVLELSFGIDRNVWAILDTFYEKKERAILKLPAQIAPISVGVFPLVGKDGLPEKAQEIYSILKKRMDCFYDDSGSIGRRYARMDEIGTPFCVTIDHDTLKDRKATIRERDSTKQKRIAIEDMATTLQKLVAGELAFDEL